MVVYRKEPSSPDPVTVSTAAQSGEDLINDAGKTTNSASHMVPRAILTSRPNSHPFQERHLILDQAVKVGRSVARCRPATTNAIFDCKVLSRNHALLWYENGKFYLQDTKSSNGTFVNNQRLSKGSEESPAQEVCSGDIVQFGVDVVENSRKSLMTQNVSGSDFISSSLDSEKRSQTHLCCPTPQFVHGCIVATLKLYLPDGKEAKASPTTAVVPLSPETSISSQELYQLSQYLQEALHREQILESKLGTLQKVVANTQDEADIGWKALIEEDRLLSRIETLESQLQTCGKNVTEEKLKDDVMKLQEDKDKYQVAAKESLKKVLQEKLEAIRKVQDLENSLSNTENECSHLGEINKKKEEEIELLLEKNSDSEKEISNLTKKLQELEEKYQDLLSQANEDKLALENNSEELRKEEQIILSPKIEENDFESEQSAMKDHYDILKKDEDNEENIERNGNLSPNDDLSSTQSDTAEKNLIQELRCEVNRLELELQRVQKENLKNENLQNSDEYTSNGVSKPEDYVNKLEAEIQSLKKHISEVRDKHHLARKAQIDATAELDELREIAKKREEELSCLQEQLSLTRQQVLEKTELIDLLESKLNSNTTEKDQGNEKEFATDSVTDCHTLPTTHSSSDEKLSGSDASDFSDIKSNYISLKENCAIYKEKIAALEADLKKCILENSVLEAQSKTLAENCTKLETEKLALEKRDGDYWNDHTIINKLQLEEKERKLLDAQEEIVLIKERFEECNKEKSYLVGELNALKEQLQLLSIQSKTVSVCSVIPLIILAIAILLAFYPTLAHLTATSDQM